MVDKMKFKITLSQLPTTPPIRGETTLPMTNIDQTYTLTYNLTENCTTTNKFISLWKQTSQSETYGCGYNFYPTIDEKMFIAMKKRMNWVIEDIKTMDEIPNVDESLVLDVSSFEREKPKLNALHLYFENVSNMPEINLSPAYVKHEKVFTHLEEINQLVHSMEDWKEPEDLEFFGTIRVRDKEFTTLPLTDEDYNNFEATHKWGDLTLDYYRVGKDLATCAATNDVELVRTKGLLQQNTVHTCFEMRFKKDEKEYAIAEKSRNLNNWIETNNLTDCYDFNLPMFASGRVVLGKIDMTGTTKDEVMSELLKCTGVTNIELI